MGGNFGSPKGAMGVFLLEGTSRLPRLRSRLLRSFEEYGHPLPEPDAECGESDLRPACLHRVHERHGNARAARSNRVAERDGASMNVHARRIEIEPSFTSDGLSGKRFVQLDELDVRHAKAGARERFLR